MAWCDREWITCYVRARTFFWTLQRACEELYTNKCLFDEGLQGLLYHELALQFLKILQASKVPFVSSQEASVTLEEVTEQSGSGCVCDWDKEGLKN